MSHFSTIKTKIKDRKALLQALMLMGHPVFVDETLKNPSDHQHEEVKVNIAIGKDIGFRWNEASGAYELVTDLQTWDQPVPVERFLDQVAQQYAIEVIQAACREEGFEEESQEVLKDNSVELIVSRWV
tara:strand:- start:755 stop:1138 length:384 start_codon:yes stop_codon:yes gene_type:complete